MDAASVPVLFVFLCAVSVVALTVLLPLSAWLARWTYAMEPLSWRDNRAEQNKLAPIDASDNDFL